MKTTLTETQELTSAMLHVAAAQIASNWISEKSTNQVDAEKQFQLAFKLIQSSQLNHLAQLTSAPLNS